MSERFADTFVAAALGLPVKTAKFCFAITCEKYKDIRTLKIRVLLIEENTLARFAPGGDGPTLKLADPKFSDRINSLEAMYTEAEPISTCWAIWSWVSFRRPWMDFQQMMNRKFA